MNSELSNGSFPLVLQGEGAGACARRIIFRYSWWDSVFVLLAILHAWLLLNFPSVLLIGIGMWWNANTISHNFIHLPFFTSRGGNRIFSICLSLLLGLPQTLWKQRHLAHHAEVQCRPLFTHQLAIETCIIAALWLSLCALSPRFFLMTYLPGFALGLMLCSLQGAFEHLRGTTSHYSRWYNYLFFNDGFHVEHHAKPGEHWTHLPRLKQSKARSSRWPAVLRWLELGHLNYLEGLALRFSWLRWFVLRSHEKAFGKLLPANLQRILIVGGGYFPRTALILQKLAPDAHLTIIDASAENIRLAQSWLNGNVTYRHSFFESNGSAEELHDLMVFPLAFDGDRQTIYSRPPARHVLVHDWLWHRHGRGVRISSFLLKRLNLVSQ